MMREIRYCLTGCKTSDGHRQTEGRAQLCKHCEDNFHTWVTTIPDLYALLPTFIEHGSVERNPDSVATKASEAPAPMRLEIIDLLDNRRGRIWNGLAPAHDRRGIAGTLQVHAERVIEERHLTLNYDGTNITTSCNLLNRHRLWIAEQDWAHHTLADIKQVHRDLSDATGNYRRPPVGHCHIETDKGRCDGPLFASTHGGVRCARCSATWDNEHLRLLGIAQAEAETA